MEGGTARFRKSVMIDAQILRTSSLRHRLYGLVGARNGIRCGKRHDRWLEQFGQSACHAEGGPVRSWKTFADSRQRGEHLDTGISTHGCFAR